MVNNVFSVVAWSIACVLWFYTGWLRGRQKGYKQGRTEFEQLFKEINNAEAEVARKEGYRQGFKDGIKSVEDVIDGADRLLMDLGGNDDIVEDAIIGALSFAVNDVRDEGEGLEDALDDEFIGGQIIGPLTKRGAEESKYDCKHCAFAETPYCEKCDYIALAGGGEGKPSHFLEAGEIEPGVDCASNIKGMIDKWDVIPLRVVNRYNSMARRKP